MANVLDNLNDFYDSARIKLAIDEKLVRDYKNQISNNLSEEQYWNNMRQEQTNDELAVIDYYNSERRKLITWENEARATEREKEARFWAKQHKEQFQREKEEREALADFWFQYRKRVEKINSDSRPSNLNFGLL